MSALDIRVGRILQVDDHPEADKYARKSPSVDASPFICTVTWVLTLMIPDLHDPD